jgi:uncharacterized membrane protein YjjP (DUF1212 family)
LKGTLVDLLVVAGMGHKRLTLVSPLLASVLVSWVVLAPFKHTLLHGGPIQLIVPALFTFIPGDTVSGAALELADHRITAGASRLVCSFVVRGVLSFDALIATVIVHAPQSTLLDVTIQGNLGPLLVGVDGCCSRSA